MLSSFSVCFKSWLHWNFNWHVLAQTSMFRSKEKIENMKKIDAHACLPGWWSHNDSAKGINIWKTLQEKSKLTVNDCDWDHGDSLVNINVCELVLDMHYENEENKNKMYMYIQLAFCFVTSFIEGK